jgi:mercuric reductase
VTGARTGFDLAVIGSGSAAFAAAIAARGHGKSVVLAERGTTGGTSVNVGCVPSKALLGAAEARHGRPLPRDRRERGPGRRAAATLAMFLASLPRRR